MGKKSVKNKTGDSELLTGNNKLAALLRALKSTYPGAHCALNYRSPWQLLVATILSAQCTDKRVNVVTPELFELYPKIIDLAEAVPEELMEIIRSTGFYRNKAKNIIGAAKTIMERFGGKVPDNMEELLVLSGVARKTANVLLYSAFEKNEGVTVDTHVLRIAKRLGLTTSDKPEQVEKDLMKLLPRQEWGHFSHLLIELGRDVCRAPRPLCAKCRVQKLCPFFHKTLAGNFLRNR